MRYATTFIVFLNIFLSELHAQDIDPLAEAFGTLPEIRNVRVSPDGSKLLMLQEINDKTIIVTRDLTNPGAAANGIPMEEGHIRAADWATNDTIVATTVGSRYMHLAIEPIDYTDSLKFREARIPILIKVDWQGNSSEEISEWGELLDILEDDPNHILIERFGRVKKLNIDTLDEEQYTVGPINAYGDYELDKDKNIRYVTSAGNSILLHHMGEKGYYRKSGGGEWDKIYDFDIRLGTGKHYQEEFDKRANFVGFTDQTNIIYIIGYDEDGRSALFTYDVDLGQKVEKVAFHEKYDITSAVFDKDYNLEAYYYNGERSIRVAVSDRMKRLDRVFNANFPESNVGIVSETIDKSKMVLLVTSPTEPGTYYLLDLNNNSMVMLGYIYQKVDVETLPTTQYLNYEARDGLTIPAYLTVPKGKEANNLPTVIIPNSSIDEKIDWGFNYYVQYLAAQGYAVLQVNYRGSDGYGKNFKYSGFFELSGKILDDINDGAKWLGEQGIADPNKICIMGNQEHSGYAALQTNVVDGALYKCIIVTDPMFNFKRYTTEWVTNYIEQDDMDSEAMSPYHRTEDLKTPVLLIWEKLEYRRGNFERERFAKNLQKSGTEVEVYTIEDLNVNNRGRKLQKIGDFLAKHLK